MSTAKWRTELLELIDIIELNLCVSATKKRRATLNQLRTAVRTGSGKITTQQHVESVLQNNPSFRGAFRRFVNIEVIKAISRTRELIELLQTQNERLLKEKIDHRSEKDEQAPQTAHPARKC